jgi:hypothetical protein
MLSKNLLTYIFDDSFIFCLTLWILVIAWPWNVYPIFIDLESLNSRRHDLWSVVKRVSLLFLGTVICRSWIWKFIDTFGFKDVGFHLAWGFVHDCIEKSPNSAIRKRWCQLFWWFRSFFGKLITAWSRIRTFHRFRATETFLVILSPIEDILLFLSNWRSYIVIPASIFLNFDIVFNIKGLNILGILRVTEQNSNFSILLAYDWSNFSLLISFS